MGVVDFAKGLWGWLRDFPRAFELQGRLRVLEAENERLRKELAFRHAAVFVEGGYYEITADGPEKGRYCSKCWDADTKRIRLTTSSTGFTRCPECKAESVAA